MKPSGQGWLFLWRFIVFTGQDGVIVSDEPCAIKHLCMEVFFLLLTEEKKVAVMRFILLINLIFFFCLGYAIAQQPVRKPFIHIHVGDKIYQDGDEVTVKKGEKLRIQVSQEGGRRDFVKFPDTYAFVPGASEILFRSDNRGVMTYQGRRIEWDLQEESAHYVSENTVKIQTEGTSGTSAVITIPSEHVTRTYLRISLKTIWKYTDGTRISREENNSEAIIYLNIAGAFDTWFVSQNIQAKGVHDSDVERALQAVQASCDTIQVRLMQRQFDVIQQEINTLKTRVDQAQSSIERAKAVNPAFKAEVSFLGLPSDLPLQYIEDFSILKGRWSDLYNLLVNSADVIDQIPLNPDNSHKPLVLRLSADYLEWQRTLPPGSLNLISRYLGGMSGHPIELPGNLSIMAREKTIGDIESAANEIIDFYTLRAEQVPSEVQEINNANIRLQAVKLYDGMLRSYFSSIDWAPWVNTRQ